MNSVIADIFQSASEGEASPEAKSLFHCVRNAREDRSCAAHLFEKCGHNASVLGEECLRQTNRAQEAAHFDLTDQLENHEFEHSPVSSKCSDVAGLSVRAFFGLVRGKSDAVNTLVSTSGVNTNDDKSDTQPHICAAQGLLHFCDLFYQGGSNSRDAELQALET